ncbi:TetR family transcriptional regulator [Streptomyces sp. NPDC005476]|uniref:TetR/AcrR family transcriptional regulator n=1 Tax=Streptomyces sp. NPDC005476 TaxID=3156882 RepID=UPI003456C590
MTHSLAREPQRRNSRSNRARILATARRELGRNPDVTLEEIARASGVVRRTLFGHFPGRAALLEALAEEASEALRGVLEAAVRPEEPAERALAHFVCSIWPVGDRYRLLLALAQRDLGTERVAGILAPARDEVTAILARGQRDGVFPMHLPPAVLSAALEGMHIALLEEVNTGALEDDGTRTAVATLVAAGVAERRARAVVDDVAAGAGAVTAGTGAGATSAGTAVRRAETGRPGR